MVDQKEIIHFVIRLMFEDDEEEETSGYLQKVWGFAEEMVPNFSDRQFHSHFRMTPTTFENLLRKIFTVHKENLRPNDHGGGNPEVAIEKQLLIALWYMSNIESFRGVADRFGISSSTAWHCLYKICKLLLQCNVTYHIISFPNLNRCNEIINAFQNKTGFPGIVGAVDGSHIPIVAPKENAASYINRKNFHSILLQGTCDNKKMFIDCYAEEVGSIHDACMFRRFDLGQRIHNLEFPQNGHLLGDSAYPLLRNLLVPYKDNGHLTEIERNYNIQHSKNRVLIEQTFAYLKGRFRRMKLLECVRLDFIPLVIISACIFHNICQGSNDITPDMNIHGEIEEERIINAGNENIVEHRINRIALVKRNNIANNLYLRI